MSKIIKRLLRIRSKDAGKTMVKQEHVDSREELRVKVEEGTARAVKEYREVFDKLAEYDRT